MKHQCETDVRQVLPAVLYHFPLPPRLPIKGSHLLSDFILCFEKLFFNFEKDKFSDVLRVKSD